MITQTKKAGHSGTPSPSNCTHGSCSTAPCSAAGLRPTVAFGLAWLSRIQSVGTTLDRLARAGAVSTATKVKVLHPEWDDTAVMEEIALILAETGAPDPVGNFPISPAA